MLSKILASAALVMALLLSACGPPEGGEGAAPEQPTQQQ